MAVDPAYERTAVEHLVEDGHREVHAPGLDEGAEAFVFLEGMVAMRLMIGHIMVQMQREMA